MTHPYRVLFWLTSSFLILIFWLPAAAQDKGRLAQGFTPVSEDAALLTTLSNNYLQHYQEGIGKLPSHYKKDLQEKYAERWKSIKERFDKQEIYTSPAAQAYLDGITAAIVTANPGLKELSFHCYFSRSYIPNASYIGEGIILFNMGLFSRLGSESEVAFILCHEIAHCKLKHSENGIARYVETINSEAIQSQLRKIKGTEYHKNEQLERLVKGLTFDSRRHSRDHEAQADSLGVELMRHSPFDPSAALTTLALLDGIDKDDFNTEASLQSVFNSPDYPFKKKWLHKEEGLLGGHALVQAEVLADSLKTHPSCQLRIRLLRPMIDAGGNGDVAGVKGVAGRGGAGDVAGGSGSVADRGRGIDTVRFAVLRELFRYETIEYAYGSNEYTESLFLSLELLRERPGDVYLVAQVGRVLNGLYAAQKGHTLSKVADLPSPDYPRNYNLLLQFVQNLYLDDLASINFYFLRSWHPLLDGYTVFKTAYEQSQRQVQQ